ncbi:VanZ family protein [Kribbella qitaiheensis]|nr:VanZ family protein [Kribbella qitaiheensis]
MQALIPLGRSCQLHDLIANTLGAFAGVGLAAAVQVATRTRTLISPAYVVEHGAVLVSRSRGPARHRRGEFVARSARPMLARAGRLHPVARLR